VLSYSQQVTDQKGGGMRRFIILLSLFALFMPLSAASLKDMSKAELKWMRSILSDLKEGNYLEAVEEHVQPCFHIMVFKSYSTPSTARPKPKSRANRKLPKRLPGYHRLRSGLPQEATAVLLLKL
jgi:hypothetical protein